MQFSKGMRAVKLRRLNPSVLNWSCRLREVGLYNGYKTGGWLFVQFTKIQTWLELFIQNILCKFTTQ